VKEERLDATISTCQLGRGFVVQQDDESVSLTGCFMTHAIIL